MRISRRDFLKMASLVAVVGPVAERGAGVRLPTSSDECGQDVEYLPVPLERVPLPRDITFAVRHGGKAPVTLRGHYWYSADALSQGKRCPAIVEFNPYRRRDGMMYADSMMYPWFAYHEYVCFRVDLQGSGDSDGIITDEYTEEELSYCVQVINQIADLPFCDGKVGMMGKSWSAVNSLIVAARDDCPSALKAIIVCCGTDDRYNDDVHYMGGAMMLDNLSWPSSMWGWLPLPPDPAIVGERWKAIWRERIGKMSFWFEQWAGHQTRDGYWSETSVRDHYDKVKVPVHILSGWWDGYKNPAERAVRNLGALGRPVSGLLGPWGHKYPFDGYPGPRIDWLRYIVSHWWDRWLKGKEPDPSTTWPELTVWLGESREPAPDREPHYVESGKWVSEDHDWMGRTKEIVFYLWPDNVLSLRHAPMHQEHVSNPDITLGTSALETSSWGECHNGDLPGDQSQDDRRSIGFDSEPLVQDLECFGYPTVRLNLECDKPLASLAIRLCEVSPQTGKSHVVAYSFFNLCYRDGDMANPQPVPPGLFAVSIPLNILGHAFKRGWKLRLSISPGYFPTLWQCPEIPTVNLHAGPIGDLAESALVLPGRDPRPEDTHVQALLVESKTAFVDPEQYVPTLGTKREGSNTRTAEPITVGDRKGILVRKVFDSGSNRYGGALDGLLVDQIAYESYTVLEGDPLSATGSTRYVSALQRGNWKVRVLTDTRVWSETTVADQVVFRYEASVQAFINDELFEEKRVKGDIPRRWV